MIPEWMEHHYRLWRLQRSQRRTDREYSEAIRKARSERQSQDDIESLISEAMMETDMASDEIYFLVTQYLRQACTRLFLPFPNHGDPGLWSESSMYGRWHLTDAGITQVRATIRKERTERLEAVMPWLAGVTGLVGALTGFVAIFLG